MPTSGGDYSTFILILCTVNPFYIDIFNIISHFALFPQTETYDIVHDWRRAVVVDLVATVKQQTTCFFQIHPQSWPINYVEWSLHRRFIDKNTTSQRGISRRLHSRLTSMEWNSLAELQTIGSPLWSPILRLVAETSSSQWPLFNLWARHYCYEVVCRNPKLCANSKSIRSLKRERDYYKETVNNIKTAVQ